VAGLPQGVHRRQFRQEERMREYRDPLGRPIRRRYLKTDVLDKRCEGIVREFMERCSGGYRLPILTDELMRLLEERARKSTLMPICRRESMGKHRCTTTASPTSKSLRAYTIPVVIIWSAPPHATSLDTSGFMRPYGGRPALNWVSPRVGRVTERFGTAIATALSTHREQTGLNGRPAG